MFEMLNKTKDWLLDILLPKFCVGCGKEGLYICKDCEVFLSEIENTTPGLTSVWEYEGLMEKLIHKIKFDGCYHIIDELAEKALGKIDLKLSEDTVITYVPMWKKKERRRGFNQSELIAQKIGNVLGLAKHALLEKTRDNRSQVGLGPIEREENVKGVFALNPLSFPSALPRFGGALRDSENPGGLAPIPRNALLVDDVYTTGATMRECMKVLRKAGVKNVYGFTLARKLSV